MDFEIRFSNVFFYEISTLAFGTIIFDSQLNFLFIQSLQLNAGLNSTIFVSKAQTIDSAHPFLPLKL